MKVVHYCKQFSKVSETFIYDYVTEIECRGIDVHVVTPKRINAEGRPFAKVSLIRMPPRWHPRRVLNRLWSVRVGDEASRVSFWPQLRERIEEALREISPDVVHTHFGPEGVLLAPVAEELNIPLVAHFRGYDVSRILPSDFWEEKYAYLFEVSSVLIGISNHICSRLEGLGAPSDKIEMLHTGVRVEDFEYDPPYGRFEGGEVVCLHVGRLVEKKSPLKLVRAFGRALDMVDGKVGLKLKIAGDGPLRRPLEGLIEKLGLSNAVECLGAVSHGEVIQLMRTSHLHTKYCQTASDGDQEGQGVTFVEASATGLPIVTTNHNGIPDIVKHGENGFLVPEGDTEAMGERIAYLALHPESWDSMGESGRQHVEANFDLAKQTDKLVQIYRNAAQQDD